MFNPSIASSSILSAISDICYSDIFTEELEVSRQESLSLRRWSIMGLKPERHGWNLAWRYFKLEPKGDRSIAVYEPFVSSWCGSFLGGVHKIISLQLDVGICIMRVSELVGNWERIRVRSLAANVLEMKKLRLIDIIVWARVRFTPVGRNWLFLEWSGVDGQELYYAARTNSSLIPS